LILCFLGAFVPPGWPYAARANALVLLVLIAILGLKVFGTPR